MELGDVHQETALESEGAIAIVILTRICLGELTLEPSLDGHEPRSDAHLVPLPAGLSTSAPVRSTQGLSVADRRSGPDLLEVPRPTQLQQREHGSKLRCTAIFYHFNPQERNVERGWLNRSRGVRILLCVYSRSYNRHPRFAGDRNKLTPAMWDNHTQQQPTSLCQVFVLSGRRVPGFLEIRHLRQG